MVSVGLPWKEPVEITELDSLVWNLIDLIGSLLVWILPLPWKQSLAVYCLFSKTGKFNKLACPKRYIVDSLRT